MKNSSQKVLYVGLVDNDKSKRDTNTIGSISESAITTRFFELGYVVYMERTNGLTYCMIPVDGVGVSKAILRLGSPKNNQEKNVRWAKDYEL